MKDKQFESRKKLALEAIDSHLSKSARFEVTIARDVVGVHASNHLFTSYEPGKSLTITVRCHEQ